MKNTLRLLMPQWQGGNNPAYSFGAELLAWLAPSTDNNNQVEVPIAHYDGTELPMEEQVVASSILLKQLEDATQIIEKYQPEKIITFGGDCLVSQAPFTYLNKKYDGRLGVIWLDAHPDVSTPEMHNHEHAMVLGNLLGQGDPQFSSQVKLPLDPNLIMYVGLQEMTSQEQVIVDELKLRIATSDELSINNQSILKWIEDNDIQHLAIHLDLDVLDPQYFRSLLFSNPESPFTDSPSGKMTLSQIEKLIKDVSQVSDIVGLSIAEHLPWDALNLKNFLGNLSILNEE